MYLWNLSALSGMKVWYRELNSQLFTPHSKMLAIKHCFGIVFCLQYICSSLTVCFTSQKTLQELNPSAFSLNYNALFIKKKKIILSKCLFHSFSTIFQTESLSSYRILSLIFLFQHPHVVHHYIINSLFRHFLGFALHHSYYLQPNTSFNFPQSIHSAETSVNQIVKVGPFKDHGS